ncbi:Adenosylcobalamin/alpha-ribazole phosphatase [Teratosphaeria destructans]|uniref:Adenosylcobalamin/alpha-ribazole phosphatase n=1 Tax=Teratosphaeria destructans TaxID=418781 RepID=A0A9W7VZP6_9PEZI|nr:Adenosylcobalamin/alpha-ribazole phosphatase [Teratosphaeria destructans]
MKLYLIRHGETVDNVAGLYAGVRNSALTNYGVEQAQRLGQYFAKTQVHFTHIFSSPLTRAYETAEAVRKAQSSAKGGEDDLQIVKVPDLIEQDFGFYEGKPFYARSDPKRSGRDAHYERHKNDPGFVDIESKESMGRRADNFLNEHLLPLLKVAEAEDMTIAIVAHGMLLSSLWKKLLLRLPRKSLTIAPEIRATRDNLVLEHLGGWSNTGYLELALSKGKVSEAATVEVTESTGAAESDLQTLPTPVLPPMEDKVAGVAAEPSTTSPREDAKENSADKPRNFEGWSTIILAIDSKQHLGGLKRQRGGIGRLAHDEGQKKLDGFFKKQRTG